jgi:hypothetical protein
MALCAENAIIRFNGLFELNLMNAKHSTDVLYKEMFDLGFFD